MQEQCERGTPARDGVPFGGRAQDGMDGRIPNWPQYTTSPTCLSNPHAHLTPVEAELWAAAEVARQRGDRQVAWQLRRRMLLCQAERYAEGAS